MSSKIGGMIERLNSKLDSLSENLKRDPLTQLLNQATFNVNFKQSLSSGSQGYAAFIKFDDLAAVSKKLGNKAVDKLLKDFADLLNNVDDRTSAYRLYGSEFALLCANFSSEDINKLANTLQQQITQLGQDSGSEDLVHIGFTRFDRSSDFDKLMPAMLESYEQAKLIGLNAFFIKEESVASMTDQEWKSTIIDTINNNTPEISFTNRAHNYATDEGELVMEEAFTVVKDSQLNNLSIGTFLSMAQEFNLVEELDKCIVNKIIGLMEQTRHATPVTINLSMHSVASSDFTSWLKNRLSGISIPAERLTFSVTAYAAAKDLEEFAQFCKFVKSLGASTLLKRYSSDIIAVDRLKELEIDYIRLSRDLTTDIQADSNKPDFLDYMHEVSNLLDIKVLAESVVDDEDFELVKKVGIYGISR
jgi:EAL domain-containing protein (putative c-di-GMP-specific phosphodiesterase class I)/GGDEF domain-containing protein